MTEEAPRYIVQPSRMLDWMVVDTKTMRSIAFRKTKEEAQACADKRNA